MHFNYTLELITKYEINLVIYLTNLETKMSYILSFRLCKNLYTVLMNRSCLISIGTIVPYMVQRVFMVTLENFFKIQIKFGKFPSFPCAHFLSPYFSALFVTLFFMLFFRTFCHAVFPHFSSRYFSARGAFIAVNAPHLLLLIT